MHVQAAGGTPHIRNRGIWLNVQIRVGTPHKILKCLRNKGGGHRTFHLRVSCQMFKQVGTPHINSQRLQVKTMMLLGGSILQVGTCQILSLAENPRWSRVWQNLGIDFF